MVKKKKQPKNQKKNKKRTNDFSGACICRPARMFLPQDLGIMKYIFRSELKLKKNYWTIFFLTLYNFYEMHSDDIIMATDIDAHMQIRIQRYVQTWIVYSEGVFRLNIKQSSGAARLRTN